MKDPDLKERLSEQQNHRCCFCGKRMGDWGVKADQPTFEHVISRVHGGSDYEENLAISCDDCNQRRGENPSFCLEEFTGMRGLPDSSVSRRLYRVRQLLDHVEGQLLTLRNERHVKKKQVAALYVEARWLFDELVKLRETE